MKKSIIIVTQYPTLDSSSIFVSRGSDQENSDLIKSGHSFYLETKPEERTPTVFSWVAG